ncbi:MAG: glycerophosphodiester phosphodiesterase family protein [Planctomycetota bacterium]
MGFLKHLHPRLAAHRGWTRTHGENTLAALQEACHQGCAAVEFDVRSTRDHHWVVYHDTHLQRLHSRPERLADLSLSELRSLAPIPTLPEALEIFAPFSCRAIIEVKPAEPVGLEELARSLEPAARRLPISLLARGPQMPEALCSRFPTLPVFLYTRVWQEARQRLAEPLAGFNLPYQTVAAEEACSQLAALRAAGKRVGIHTINDPAECALWLSYGADWVTTDCPWLMALGDGDATAT